MAYSQSPAATDRTLTGKNRAILYLVLAAIVMTALLVVSERAGVPVAYTRNFTALVLVAAFLAAGLRNRTSQLDDWLHCARQMSPYTAGAAVAVAAMSGPVLISLGGLFLSEGPMAIVLLASLLLGLAASTLLIAPFATSVAGGMLARLLESRFPGPFLRTLVMISAAAACLLLLWAQMSTFALLGGLYFNVDAGIAVIVIAVLVAATLVPGGLFGVAKSSLGTYAIIAVTFLAPMVWITVRETGIPLPQLGFGYAALERVGPLEAQLRALGVSIFTEGIPTGWPDLTNGIQIAAATVVLTGGFLVLPVLLAGFQGCGNADRTRRSGTAAIAFLAIVVTAAPAAAWLAKLGLYENLIGLTAGEIGANADFALRWAAKSALLSNTGSLIELCGRPAASGQALIAACGSDPDRVIGPADIKIHGEIVSLALADLTGLPAILAPLAGIGFAAISLGVASAAAFGFSTILAEGYRNFASTSRIPAGIRLFRLRVAAIAGIAAAGWLATNLELSPIFLTLWALAICAGTLAPLLLATVWLPALPAGGAVFATVVALFVLIEFPLLHWLSNSGTTAWQPSGFAIPGLDGLPAAIQAGFLAAVSATAVILVSSIFFGRKTGQVAIPGIGPGPNASETDQKA